MPILISRTVTPNPLRQLAAYSPRGLRTQVRCLHDSAAGSSLELQTDAKEGVKEDAPPLRARKHGYRALPVSPLMRKDSAKKHIKQTVHQDDDLKEFRKEVAMNPYGKHTQT